MKRPRKTILIETMPKELKNGVKPTTETTESIEESSTSIKTPLPEEEPAKKRTYFNPFSIGAKQFLEERESETALQKPLNAVELFKILGNRADPVITDEEKQRIEFQQEIHRELREKKRKGSQYLKLPDFGSVEQEYQTKVNRRSL